MPTPKINTVAQETKDLKVSFRLTNSVGARLAERAKAGESPSQTAARVLEEALAQSSFEASLASLPALSAAAKTLIDDVPKALADQIVAEVSLQSAQLMSQKISDFAAAQAARDDQSRQLQARLLTSIAKIEDAQLQLARGIFGLQKAFA